MLMGYGDFSYYQHHHRDCYLETLSSQQWCSLRADLSEVFIELIKLIDVYWQKLVTGVLGRPSLYSFLTWGLARLTCVSEAAYCCS